MRCIILYVSLICIAVLGTNGTCGAQCSGVGESVSAPCDGPPWSGSVCPYYTCGVRHALGFLNGGWTDASIDIVVHSEGGADLYFTWIPATGTDTPNTDYVGTRYHHVPGGSHVISYLSVLSDIFDIAPSDVRVGALQIQWRACGDSYVYFDGWAQRRDRERFNSYGERGYIHTHRICPLAQSYWKGDCLPLARMVDGCYEVEIPPGTEYVRSQFLNTDESEWQSVWVDGETQFVPPLVGGAEQMISYNFVPSSNLITVCVGKEFPWSDAGSFSDACILTSFETVSTEHKERVSIPPRPQLVFD